MARFVIMPLILESSNASNVSNYWFSIKYVTVVIIFIYLLWIFSKWLTKRNYVSLKDRKIKILERLALSSDKHLVLVELENIFYLLGVDKTGITVIDKRDDLSLDDFLPKIHKDDDATSFINILNSTIVKRKQKDNDSGDS